MDLETEVYSGNSQKAVQRYTTVWKVISLFVLLATTIKITTFCPNMTKISGAVKKLEYICKRSVLKIKSVRIVFL